MKKASVIFNRKLLAAALAIVVAPQFARAGSARQCPLQSGVLQGSYVTAGSGEIAGLGPIASVGLVVYEPRLYRNEGPRNRPLGDSHELRHLPGRKQAHVDHYRFVSNDVRRRGPSGTLTGRLQNQ